MIKSFTDASISVKGYFEFYFSDASTQGNKMNKFVLDRLFGIFACGKKMKGPTKCQRYFYLKKLKNRKKNKR